MRMTPAYEVTRAHLKSALDARNWDLLDRLLEIDRSRIDDPALYTDTWGAWWGLLFEAVARRQVVGVRILLKHGARREVGVSGDCDSVSPETLAQEMPEILALLRASHPPQYRRQSEPVLPGELTPAEREINRVGEIRDATGQTFQPQPPRP